MKVKVAQSSPLPNSQFLQTRRPFSQTVRRRPYSPSHSREGTKTGEKSRPPAGKLKSKSKNILPESCFLVSCSTGNLIPTANSVSLWDLSGCVNVLSWTRNLKFNYVFSLYLGTQVSTFNFYETLYVCQKVVNKQLAKCSYHIINTARDID